MLSDLPLTRRNINRHNGLQFVAEVKSGLLGKPGAGRFLTVGI